MSLQFLPFRFAEIDGRFLLTNVVGDYIWLQESDFFRFVSGQISEDEDLCRDLQSKHMISSGDLSFDINLLASRFRSKKAFIEDGPVLHMVVTTLRCNQKCVYCQASAQSHDGANVDMSIETAHKVAEKIMQSRCDCVKVEFQGGEPTLNFSAIKAVVEKISELNAQQKKHVEYVVCTNLYDISPEQLDFFKEYSFDISTSIDGPAHIHDTNRISWNDSGTFQNVTKNISLSRRFVGDRVNALLTISRQNISHLKEIVDTYIELGFRGITLRPLNPYGRCVENKNNLCYSVQEYIDAYSEALEYIIELGLKGIPIREGYATLLLRRMLTPFATGFVDLQSPCGAALSCVIYNYNGNIYACDEGRMLSAMGDETFKLGSVNNSAADVFCGEIARQLAHNSIVETIPQCSECPFAVWCGADPVRGYATTRHFVPMKFESEFCERHKKLFLLLLNLLERDDKTRRLLYSWAWGSEV